MHSGKWHELPPSLHNVLREVRIMKIVSVEGVRKLSCCTCRLGTFIMSSRPWSNATPWSVKALGVTGNFWRHHRSRPWISYSADSRCTQDDFNLATSLWINCLGAKHEFDFLKLRKVLRATRHRSMAVTAELALRSCWRKKLICSEGRHTKDFGSIYFSVPENSSPYAKKACCQRWSITGNEKGKIGESFGYPFAQSFPCAGASFHRNTCFFPFDQNGRFSTGCITIGDVQQVDSGIGWSSLTTLKSSACSAEVATKTTEFWTCMADYSHCGKRNANRCVFMTVARQICIFEYGVSLSCKRGLKRTQTKTGVSEGGGGGEDSRKRKRSQTRAQKCALFFAKTKSFWLPAFSKV